MRYSCIIFFVEFCTLFVAFSNADFENTLVLDTFFKKPNTSMVVAVLPLRMSLCKLTSIAEGQTKEQLMKALDYKTKYKINTCYTSLSELIDGIRHTDLTLLNKLYVNYSGEVDTGFLFNSSSAYGVNVEFVGFNLPRAAFSYINNGIASATYRRIRDVVEHRDITSQTKMMMITAAHLKATWEVPFDVKDTKNKKFYHLGNKVSEIPMMIKEDSFQMYENSNYKVLTANLRSPGASITLVVPSESRGLPHLLAQMRFNPNLMKEARAGMTIQHRKLIMPRLKIKSYLDLTELLKNSTVNEIFNSNSSDLDGMLKAEFRDNSNMFVNKVKQKLFIEVDELGLARQVISPEDQNYNRPRASFSAREFAADRPFYFVFDLQEFMPSADKLTTVYHQLLTGVYYGPE